ncbi:hypothetical protein HK101_000518, partial [Irineochytrium annulatum]
MTSLSTSEPATGEERGGESGGVEGGIPEEGVGGGHGEGRLAGEVEGEQGARWPDDLDAVRDLQDLFDGITSSNLLPSVEELLAELGDSVKGGYSFLDTDAVTATNVRKRPGSVAATTAAKGIAVKGRTCV